MAAPARSVMFFGVGEREPVSHPLRVSEVASRMEEDGEKQEMCRHLFERFMAYRSPFLFPIGKVWACPCVIYTMSVSIKKAQASWSHRTSRRFFPERRGSVPIPIYRVAAGTGGQAEVEKVMEPPGVPGGELCQPGVVSINLDERYDLLELSRKKGVLHKEGSSVLWREVAVIRGLPGGHGITVTSHVDDLVVRLHDILFFLSGPSATADLRFKEQWFRLPAGWTEERLYAEDGFHIIDIASPVENLVRKLCDLREQEEKEMERQKLETEGERERRLYEEEQRRVREEEERRKIREENLLETKRRSEEEAAMPRKRAPSIWDASLWLINNEVHPASVRCYSKFKLSMNSNKKVSCEFVDKVGLQDMLQRAENWEYVLPISKTAPAAASSSRALETLGFVEGYFDMETEAFGPRTGQYIDRSGRMVSAVLMVSRSAAKALTITVLVQKLDIVMDDGMVMSCCYSFSVDIHCDDISSSELLKKDWAYHMFCKNVDGEGRISFSTLVAHLKKKLQLQLTEEELRLYSMSVMHGEEDDRDILEAWQKLEEWVPPKPKRELEDVELQDCTLFPLLWES